MIASSPSSRRSMSMAWPMVGAISVLSRFGRDFQAGAKGDHGSDLPQSLDPRLGMDLVLRHDHGGRPEPLDDRADIRPDRRAGQQGGALADHREPVEGLAHRDDEFL